MLRLLCAILLAFLPACISALHLAPWYPNVFEVQPKVSYLWQHSSRLDSSRGDFGPSLHANFLHSSVSMAYYDWYGELETLLAESSYRYFNFDSAALSVRYHLANDISLADPVSMVATFSVMQAIRKAVNDPTSFHHGKLEGIAHISLGKEYSCHEFWTDRLWGAVGLGLADVGSPWWHVQLNLERNWLDQQFLALFCDILVGWGGKGLPHRFYGYGPIAHRSLDLGVNYQYSFNNGLKASCSYAYRIFARNFPKDTNSLMVSLVYPFGL